MTLGAHIKIIVPDIWVWVGVLCPVGIAHHKFISVATGLFNCIWFGLLGFNASATARVISRRWNDDENSFLVEETGVPGGNHRPTVFGACTSKWIPCVRVSQSFWYKTGICETCLFDILQDIDWLFFYILQSTGTTNTNYSLQGLTVYSLTVYNLTVYRDYKYKSLPLTLRSSMYCQCLFCKINCSLFTITVQK